MVTNMTPLAEPSRAVAGRARDPPLAAIVRRVPAWRRGRRRSACGEGLRAGRKPDDRAAYTVIWYGRQGIVEKTPFEAEKVARDHGLATFPSRKEVDGIVAVEIRKDDGTVVFSLSG